jgi:non-homologous end joining protein Ku
MVLIPCAVYTGTEETRVTRKEFVKDGDSLVEVGRSPIRKDTGNVIDNIEVGRYAQANNGEWVILTDDEIADCTSPKGIGEIVSFVPVKSVGSYLAEGQAQVRPKREKGKTNVAADRAFSLLVTAMKANKVVALVKIAMRGPARYALLDERGTFTLIRTADAIRQPIYDTLEQAQGYKFDKAEIALATALIDAVGVDTPVLTDDTAPVVQEFVNAKSSGKPAPVRQALPDSPVDIMAALQASIDATKASKGKVA